MSQNFDLLFKFLIKNEKFRDIFSEVCISELKVWTYEWKKSFVLFFSGGNRRPKILIFWSVKMFLSSSSREAEGAPWWLQLNYSAIKW